MNDFEKEKDKAIDEAWVWERDVRGHGCSGKANPEQFVHRAANGRVSNFFWAPTRQVQLDDVLSLSNVLLIRNAVRVRQCDCVGR